MLANASLARNTATRPHAMYTVEHKRYLPMVRESTAFGLEEPDSLVGAASRRDDVHVAVGVMRVEIEDGIRGCAI